MRQYSTGHRGPRPIHVIALILGVAFLLFAQFRQPAGLLLLLGVGGAALVAMVLNLVHRGPTRRLDPATGSDGVVRIIDFPPLADEAPEWSPALVPIPVEAGPAPTPVGGVPPVLTSRLSLDHAPRSAAPPRREGRLPIRRAPSEPVSAGPLPHSNLTAETPAWRTKPIPLPHHASKAETEAVAEAVVAPAPARIKLTLSPVPATAPVSPAHGAS